MNIYEKNRVESISNSICALVDEARVAGYDKGAKINGARTEDAYAKGFDHGYEAAVKRYGKLLQDVLNEAILSAENTIKDARAQADEAWFEHKHAAYENCMSQKAADRWTHYRAMYGIADGRELALKDLCKALGEPEYKKKDEK